jgi:hypothetical protein
MWGGTGGGAPERMYLRNNIFRTTHHAFSTPPNSSSAPLVWDEDYNHFYTTHNARGLNYADGNYLRVADYRAASGQGAHTNLSSDFHGQDPEFVNASNGNLALPGDSPFIDYGQRVPNISDRADQFDGNRPDLGARESPYTSDRWGGTGGSTPTSTATPNPSTTLTTTATPTATPQPGQATATRTPTPTRTATTTTSDTTPPWRPTILTPWTYTETTASSYLVTGNAEANSLVQVYRDLDNDGNLDDGEPSIGEQQLNGGDTSFEISVPLVLGNNDFVLTATDAAGNESAGRGSARVVRK